MNAPLTQKFDYLPGVTLRAVALDGAPWFVAKDVCDALGYRNGRGAVKEHVQDTDKGVAICDTLGGAQSLTVINESGLYALVLKSYKVEARAFQQWVTGEVLGGITDSEGRGIPLGRPPSDSPPKVTPEGPLLVPARMVLGWQQ